MVLMYLIATYGVVLIEKVKEQENNIKSMTFHPVHLFIILYRPIKEDKHIHIQPDIIYTQRHTRTQKCKNNNRHSRSKVTIIEIKPEQKSS